MGRKWEGEELLKFYVFVIYNFDFLNQKRGQQYKNFHQMRVQSTDQVMCQTKGSCLTLKRIGQQSSTNDANQVYSSSTKDQRVPTEASSQTGSSSDDLSSSCLTDNNFGSNIHGSKIDSKFGLNLRQISEQRKNNESQILEGNQLSKYGNISSEFVNVDKDCIIDEKKTKINSKNKRKKKKSISIGRGFYGKMLEYINEGREERGEILRKISHLRCRMSKFFAMKKQGDSIHYLTNGKLRFEDVLLHYYRVESNVLHTSKDLNWPKLPHNKDYLQIKKQLMDLFRLEFVIDDDVKIDNLTLNKIEWKSFMTNLYKQIHPYVKCIEKQKEIFRRMDSEDITDWEIHESKQLIESLKKKNKLMIKAITAANTYYKLNKRKIASQNINISSFSQEIQEANKFRTQKPQTKRPIKPFDSGNTSASTAIPQFTTGNKKLKVGNNPVTSIRPFDFEAPKIKEEPQEIYNDEEDEQDYRVLTSSIKEEDLYSNINLKKEEDFTKDVDENLEQALKIEGVNVSFDPDHHLEQNSGIIEKCDFNMDISLPGSFQRSGLDHLDENPTNYSYFMNESYDQQIQENSKNLIAPIHKQFIFSLFQELSKNFGCSNEIIKVQILTSPLIEITGLSSLQPYDHKNNFQVDLEPPSKNRILNILTQNSSLLSNLMSNFNDAQ